MENNAWVKPPVDIPEGTTELYAWARTTAEQDIKEKHQHLIYRLLDGDWKEKRVSAPHN